MTATHYFCGTCGIYPFHRKRVTPDYYGINVHCLEASIPPAFRCARRMASAMS